MPRRTIEEVIKNFTGRVISMPGIAGTAQGLFKGKPCIKVYVSTKSPEMLGRIPAAVEGYPVSVEETGDLRALDR